MTPDGYHEIDASNSDSLLFIQIHYTGNIAEAIIYLARSLAATAAASLAAAPGCPAHAMHGMAVFVMVN